MALTLDAVSEMATFAGITDIHTDALMAFALQVEAHVKNNLQFEIEKLRIPVLAHMTEIQSDVKRVQEALAMVMDYLNSPPPNAIYHDNPEGR